MIVISAPFGNWFKPANCVITVGTYTLHYRGGLWKRIWRVLKTTRYNRRQQSWINKLGLPNPGITAFQRQQDRHDIVSIHGFNTDDWHGLVRILKYSPCLEFNLSCPNVGHKPDISEVSDAIRLALGHGQKVICKLPPIRWMDYAEPLHVLGVRCFHCCNTIPTPGGGVSGKPLMQYSLWAVKELRREMPDVELIGGGGVTCVDDVRKYLDAGADHVAIASMLFNPLNWRKVKHFTEVASAEFCRTSNRDSLRE